MSVLPQALQLMPHSAEPLPALQATSAFALLETAELGLFLVQDWTIRYLNPAMAKMVNVCSSRLNC